MSTSPKVGLFGGTFDPPHLGHLGAAQAVASQVGIEEIRFVVAHDPWQKSDQRVVTPATMRREMVELLIQDQAGFTVDDREIRRGGPSYTADTLEEIHSERPDVDLYLIVGQDSAAAIGATWQRPEVIFHLATLVVVTRPHAALQKSALPSDSIYVEMTPVDVSSSQIRHVATQGGSLAHLTTDSVAQFISSNGLYRGAL